MIPGEIQTIVFFFLCEEEEIQQDGENFHARHQPTWKDYVLHGLLVFWRLIFAFIPPEGMLLLSVYKYLHVCKLKQLLHVAVLYCFFTFISK